ncbi:hypothetical protein ACVWZK_000486 [Bradyrhizobium sp. GM0.4]
MTLASSRFMIGSILPMTSATPGRKPLITAPSRVARGTLIARSAAVMISLSRRAVRSRFSIIAPESSSTMMARLAPSNAPSTAFAAFAAASIWTCVAEFSWKIGEM